MQQSEKHLKNYIGGKLVEPVSGTYIDNYEPATGAVYSYIPDSDVADVERAVETARAAFPKWAGLSAQKRSVILSKIASLITDNLAALADAESKDNGKPVSLARAVDIPRAASNFEFYATAIQHFSSEAHETDESIFNYTIHQPIGIVGCISPWNLPLYLFSWKIAPALAAGNCVVAKPSEITPMTAYLLSKICIDAGLPEGVLNIVHGYGHKVGQAIVDHPDIKAISFTGGTATGKKIAESTATQFKKLSLEMGGKNPNIIFADCNFDEALKTTINSSFANQGQICLCGSRVFVERPIYDKFREAFVERVKQLKVGDPMDAETNMGAVVSKDHQEKVLSYIRLAEAEGGTVLTGGDAVRLSGRCENGYFIAPTVIDGLTQNCRVNNEEIFGPVVALIPFDTEEEVIEFANATEYGLSATIWTTNLSRAHRVARLVHSGIIWINCWLVRDLRTPFGGMKQSGMGREGGWEALKFFSEPKNICIKLER